MRRTSRKTEQDRPVRRRSGPARIVARALNTIRRARESRRERTLQRLLEQHRTALQACRQSLRATSAPDVGDELEHGVDHLVRSVGAALAELSSGTVRGIEAALRRLADGDYGTCTDCGQRIAAARLKVLPFAERCRDCQSQHDSGRASEAAIPSLPQAVSWARS